MGLTTLERARLGRLPHTLDLADVAGLAADGDEVARAKWHRVLTEFVGDGTLPATKRIERVPTPILFAVATPGKTSDSRFDRFESWREAASQGSARARDGLGVEVYSLHKDDVLRAVPSLQRLGEVAAPLLDWCGATCAQGNEARPGDTEKIITSADFTDRYKLRGKGGVVGHKGAIAKVRKAHPEVKAGKQGEYRLDKLVECLGLMGIEANHKGSAPASIFVVAGRKVSN